ncbi:hypothetical protein llap_20807 [Limosa lapponica baueri]|uniref:Uncharacterized protein n=1 Tax=Limosa lapponica baueri TaxID=1758121 RepID=A0A2I0T527_LIMLA|nr:hypothetical protein llap_20807 [Limosa lapponica baueri]
MHSGLGPSLAVVLCSYLSEEDVLDRANPFVQLVSGVVWLLRDGEVYVSQSRVAECGDTQTTARERIVRATACGGGGSPRGSRERKAWLSMTSVLALLLVISAVGNVGLLLKARSERQQESGDYLYHPLKEMNGEAGHASTSCETDDAQDQSQALLQSPG